VQDLRNKRVALYARYSSNLQRETSLEDQLRRCREFVVRHGGVVDDDLVFCDAAISGSSTKRPAFELMMKLVDARPRAIDAIVAEDLSRVSRDSADSAQLFKRLEYLGVPLLGVGDGIDTSAKSGKLSYHIKSFVNETYIDDLRDKTRRGLDGRALAGYSTGGLPMGYRGVPERDAHDRPLGSRIEIDDEGAAVIRRIFQLYLEGNSLEAIARRFNDEKVLPPRAKTKHRRKGWVSSTIRMMLHNRAYIGHWKYKDNEWVKVPGTNDRRPRPRDPSEVIHREYPERCIIDADTWNAVQARLASVRACYVKPKDGQPKGAVQSGRRNAYPLSGLLYCGVCGAPMTIHAGTSARYYRCSDQKKRGTCSNKLPLREDIAKARLYEAFDARYRNPLAVLYLRQQIAQRLGEKARERTSELDERRERLGRTEERIAGLVEFIARGDQSTTVRKTLIDLEASAKAERAAIEALLKTAAKPIALPSPNVALFQLKNFWSFLEAEPLRGRELLKQFFEQGRLVLQPQPEGHYVAESRFFPLRVLRLLDEVRACSEGQKDKNHKSENLWSSHRCAGALGSSCNDANYGRSRFLGRHDRAHPSSAPRSRLLRAVTRLKSDVNQRYPATQETMYCARGRSCRDRRGRSGGRRRSREAFDSSVGDRRINGPDGGAVDTMEERRARRAGRADTPT
jgi:DNA invertase Pin-like site-specific DNA recombinase